MNGFIIKNLWPAAKSFLHILMSPPLWTSHAFVVYASGVLCVCVHIRVCLHFCLCWFTCVYPLRLCGAPTAQTLTTPPINTVRHASSNRLVFNHSCHRHVYGNTHVYVSNVFMIAESICSIFPQMISDENPQLRVCPTQCHQTQLWESMFIKSWNNVVTVLQNLSEV